MITFGAFSIYVDDQDRALRFYTELLGFTKKNDLLVGGARWLTIVPSAHVDGTELLLEPNGNPIAAEYQKNLYDARIPAAVFAVDDLVAEHRRLASLGVVFTMRPTEMGANLQAMLDDGCGNLILLNQPLSDAT
ncbi:VOC family protein [Hoyosella subflava]|uniref:VOC domain-containing protein n=1 Tax=Hoyosella subflava (strain DSM 45089 / JCM 17490 / NBRC 109087 / DQS3-9A1) TaxID=443218 RepID=F6EPE5_HOYSD|nr:VOC family protein [Hoyosella subflava]AEF42994.1 hypothetical protein AS9A_4562 [Hoyosella subflava DQS3-9A1]